VNEVPGGRVDAGKLVSGLARAAECAGAHIIENARVDDVKFEAPLRFSVSGQWIEADKAIFASNAQSLELSGLAGRAEPMFTMALATESLSDEALEALGMASGKSFYTVDFPYLWGRILSGGRIIFGGGLVRLNDWRELAMLDVGRAEAAERLDSLEKRVHRLDPILRDTAITHRWGGPMLAGAEWRPAFRRHPRSADALVLGAYSGHGVALSVYLGRWAAEALLGRREVPAWERT
jgi:glycine/D-amino acid oxidase-like deaminating enzyme